VNASLGLGWTSEKAPSSVPSILFPVAVTGVLFYIDLHAPARMMFGLPYLLAVIFAQGIAGGKAATVSAAVAGVLVLAAPLLGVAGNDPLWLTALGRVSVVGAIGIMVLFLRQRDEARATLLAQVGANQDTSSRRSDELRLVSAQLHREIAERRRAEVRSSYLASIVESSADAIIGQTLDGTVVSWNSGAGRVYGHTRDSVLGQPSSRLVPPEVAGELSAVLARVARGEKVEEVRQVRLRSDGSRFEVSATFSPILDEKGAILGASVIERDITRRMHEEESMQRRQAELEARVLRRTEDLESALGELDTFRDVVSRDLRQPLQDLKELADALAASVEGRLTDTEKDVVRRLREAANRTERLGDDLATLSRANDVLLDKEVVNFGDAARSVIEDLRESDPDHQVQWEIGEGLLAWGDTSLLRVVVRNLLGYSFASTRGRSDARIEFVVEERAGDSVTYRLADNGAGLDAAEAAHLFDALSPERREALSGARAVALATVGRIVERHEGNLWAEGRKGGGTTIRFRLPVPKRSRSFDDDYDDEAGMEYSEAAASSAA
jgi:PAS domain S-box-containing protein